MPNTMATPRPTSPGLSYASPPPPTPRHGDEIAIAGEFVHTIGDAHVYLNHRCALREQLARAPRPFPMLTIKDRADGPVTDIDGFQFSDFEITGYKPHGAIKMQMAV